MPITSSASPRFFFRDVQNYCTKRCDKYAFERYLVAKYARTLPANKNLQRRIRYKKNNKYRRADSCGAIEDIDSGFNGLLHHSAVSRLQPSLLGIRLMRLRAFQFWKMSWGALAIFRAFFWVPGGRPAGFCVVLGSGKLGEGRLGW
jgi:hypothetical protein